MIRKKDIPRKGDLPEEINERNALLSLKIKGDDNITCIKLSQDKKKWIIVIEDDD